MDGSTKILTVSYGTFSCTLEGFDDPLGAMRDIAEYFRDLAADDRYFGAEPPTPDVEMLQSIAGRDVNRRVEARASETGVALRQVDHADDAIEATPAEAPKSDDNSKEDAKEDAGAIAARVVSAARAADPETDDAPEEDTPDTGTGPLTFDDDFLMADEPEDVLAVDPSARVASDGPAESVAEKLRRIRAVVSRNIDAKAEAPAEDKVDTEASEKRDRALTRTIEQITEDLADDEDEAAPEAETSKNETPDQDEIENETAESAARDTSEALWVRDAEAEEEASADDLLGDEPGLTDEASDDDGFEAAESIFTEPSDESDDEAEAAAEGDDTIERRISDIIGNVAERIDEDSDDDRLEDDAEVEAIADQPEGNEPKHGLNKPLAEDQDEDVGRILAETDTKLNEDEVVRRRRVISQMRAAVAATKADRLVSRQVPRETVEEEERSPYRNDLSEVVRTTKAEGDTRPQSSTPPLVLVSSQRVDADEDAPGTADLPEDFADFAETMGAKELPELLEAAAAYTVFGEGHPSFTRPEIMKRVAAVDPTIRMSREESLRSFGQLLRQGKFHKLERGQFTIDQDTKFNPKPRIAGE